MYQMNVSTSNIYLIKLKKLYINAYIINIKIISYSVNCCVGIDLIFFIHKYINIYKIIIMTLNKIDF